MTAIHLPIHNTTKVIQYTQAILDFIIFAQYVLQDKEILHYTGYKFYRLEKT